MLGRIVAYLQPFRARPEPAPSLASVAPYADLMRQIATRRAKHLPVRDLKDRQRQMIHAALRGSR